MVRWKNTTVVKPSHGLWWFKPLVVRAHFPMFHPSSAPQWIAKASFCPIDIGICLQDIFPVVFLWFTVFSGSPTFTPFVHIFPRERGSSSNCSSNGANRANNWGHRQDEFSSVWMLGMSDILCRWYLGWPTFHSGCLRLHGMILILILINVGVLIVLEDCFHRVLYKLLDWIQMVVPEPLEPTYFSEAMEAVVPFWSVFWWQDLIQKMRCCKHLLDDQRKRRAQLFGFKSTAFMAGIGTWQSKCWPFVLLDWKWCKSFLRVRFNNLSHVSLHHCITQTKSLIG